MRMEYPSSVDMQPDDDQFISDFGATLGEVREKMRRLEESRSTRLDTVGMTVRELEEAEVRRQALVRAETELIRLRAEAGIESPLPTTAPVSGPLPTAKRNDLPLWAKWTLPILALIVAVTLGLLKLLNP